MKFGEFIKTRRVILKLTQAELSNFLHITPQSLSNYENDKTKIPLSIIIDLCYYLKISINDFFNQNISNEEVTLYLNNYNIDNIYKNLAYYREKSKLTLKELSKKIKISIQRLSDFELGKALPSIEEFITLCNFYNLNYEELFLINNETNLIPNNNQKITKQKPKKYFYAGLAGFLGIIAVISLSISLGIFYSKSKEKKLLSVPNFSKILFRESLDESSSTDIFIKNKDYYLFAYLDNSYNYPISSFKINDIFYKKDIFHEESTNKKVIIKFNSSVLNLGENNFNVNGFTYINERNKENYVTLSNINTKVDKYDTVQDSYIFENLFLNTIYNITYNYSYDLKDGLGIQTESSSIRVQTLAYKAPRVFFDAVSPDANSIYFKIAKEEEKIPATYIKTELYKGSTLYETTTLEEGKFRELEANYKYTLKLYYSYYLLDGNGIIDSYFTSSVTTSTGIIIEEI